MRRTLRQTAQTEVDRAQKLMGPITEVARLGDQAKLRKFCEGWMRSSCKWRRRGWALNADAGTSETGEAKHSAAVERFEIRRGGQRLGWLQVRAYGAMISGETYAALEFLCEQLPGAFDLCRLIEEKLQLERELAERERLALVGQMARAFRTSQKSAGIDQDDSPGAIGGRGVAGFSAARDADGAGGDQPAFGAAEPVACSSAGRESEWERRAEL